MQKWFIDIGELQKYFEQNREGLEPIKTFEKYRQSPYYDHARSLLRRALDHIRANMIAKKYLATH